MFKSLKEKGLLRVLKKEEEKDEDRGRGKGTKAKLMHTESITSERDLASKERRETKTKKPM